jgi:hypothetical protein
VIIVSSPEASIKPGGYRRGFKYIYLNMIQWIAAPVNRQTDRPILPGVNQQ